MPLSIRDADLFGVCTIVVVVVVLLLEVVCGVYLVYFRWRSGTRRYLVLKNFNSSFNLRVLLVFFGALWAVLELLRLTYFRRNNRLLSSLSYKEQGIACQVYIISSQGLVTPCFFLTTLLLLRGSLQTLPTSAKRKEKTRGKHVQVLLNILPFFLLQALLVVLVEGEGREGDTSGSIIRFRGVPSLVNQAYQRDPVTSTIATCTFPLLSTAVLSAFAGLFCTFFFYCCRQILPVIINKCLYQRLLVLLVSFLLLLPLHIVLRGLSLLWQPGDLLFELSALLALLAMAVCTVVGQGILVLWPICDALDTRVLTGMDKKCTSMKDTSDLEDSNVEPGLLFSDSALGHISSEEESLDGKDDKDTPTPNQSTHSDDFSKDFSFGVLAHSLPKSGHM